MAERKMTQTQVLEALHIPITKLEISEIENNGKLQQTINQLANAHGLPEPFSNSAGSAIIQDLIPFAAIAGTAAAAGAAGASAGADAAGGATATEGAAAGGAGGGALGYTSKALQDLSSLAKAGGLAALLVDPSFTWRMVKIIGGAILILLGLRQLAAAGGANVGSKLVAR